MNPETDLHSQQQHLSSIDNDLRITNLARFIYQKILRCHPELDSGSIHKTGFRVEARNDKAPKLLDVGAGNGLFLKFFIKKGFQIAGYELEQTNVDNMKKDPALKDVDIRQGDITKLMGQEEYDIVLASDVIEHIKDDVLAIRNLWSFVKPGGLLVITVPAHAFLYGKRDETWGHYRRYGKQSLRAHIEEAIKNTPPPDVRRGTPLKGRSSPGEPPSRGEGLKGRGCFHIEFFTFWNIVGFFVYFLFEKILHKPINEQMRYSDSLFSRLVRGLLGSILRVEEAMGGSLIGLTLVVGVRKNIFPVQQEVIPSP